MVPIQGTEPPDPQAGGMPRHYLTMTVKGDKLCSFATEGTGVTGPSLSAFGICPLPWGLRAKARPSEQVWFDWTIIIN